jgi:hypothetical protein
MLTLRELTALIKRHEQEQEWQDYQTARICSMLYNINRDPKRSKAVTPHDFMVTGNPQSKSKQTPDQMLEILKDWAAYSEVTSRQPGQPR